MSEPLSPFEDRAFAVLDYTFRGIYHCEKIIKESGPNPRWILNTYQNLSTFDYDLLTRLVLSAHKYCVRAEIRNSGPGRVKIVLTNRARTGMMHERHPTIQEAIESSEL